MSYAEEIAGLRAVLVHAKDSAGKSFYEKFGFEPSPIDAYHLFLRISDIQASIVHLCARSIAIPYNMVAEFLSHVL